MNAGSYWTILRSSNGAMAAVAVAIGFIIASGLAFSTGLAMGMAAIFLIAGAGIVVNDFFDIEIDRINEPKRPLPSGKISEKNALIYAAVLFAAGIALSAAINVYCLGLALLNTVLEILYAWKLKRIALVGNFTDSWFPATSFVYGSLIAGTLAVPILFLAFIAFLANTSREIFGDIQDIEGDRQQGAKTLPIVSGERKAGYAAAFFTFFAVALSVGPWILGMLNLAYLYIVAAADALFVHAVFQEPGKNQLEMKVAMVIALLAFIAGVF